MRLTSIALMLGASGLALGACTETTRNYSVDAGDIGETLNEGKTLTARKQAETRANIDYGTGDTALNTQDDRSFELRRDDDGELTMVVDGVEHKFTEDMRVVSSDGNTYGYQKDGTNDGIWFSLFNQAGEIDEVMTAGTGYAKPLGYYTNQLNEGQPEHTGFAVVGTETKPDALGDLPTANYSGFSQIRLQPQEGYVDFQNSVSRLRGDLNMTADFSAANVSGSISDLTLQNPGSETRDALGGSISMSSADITDNGFAGKLSGNAALSSAGLDIETGNYSGNFYGPMAEEIGGVTSVTGTLNGAASNGVGFFVGSQPE